MLKFRLVAALLFLAPSSAAALQLGDAAARVPHTAELRALYERAWPDFARRIRHHDRLTETPSRLTSLSGTLCRAEMRDTYECVSLVEYQLPGGIRRSSLLRHHVSRDSQGRLEDAILIRETPRPS